MGTQLTANLYKVKIMRCIALMLLALWFSGCATPFTSKKTGGGIPMTLQGVTFVSPNEEGWAVHQSPDSNEVSLSRLWTNQDTNVILVKDIHLDQDLSDREFISFLQANLDRRGPTPRYEIVTKHYVPQYFKQATCLKYDVVIADHQVNKDIVTTGYGCRHPQESRLIVVFEITQRSQSQVLSPHLAALGEIFFKQINFVSPAK